MYYVGGVGVGSLPNRVSSKGIIRSVICEITKKGDQKEGEKRKWRNESMRRERTKKESKSLHQF